MTRSTAAQNSALLNDDGGTGASDSPGRGGVKTGSGVRGARSAAMIASIRAHARS